MLQIINSFSFLDASEIFYKFDEEPNNFPIALDYVKCQGSENSLKDCVHFSHSYSECGHSDDVGVRCQPGSYVTHCIKDNFQ